MKKIILILICIAIISCTSNNENNEANLMKEKIVGSWKMVGYYDDNGNDPITGNYHPVVNGEINIFLANNTFNSDYDNFVSHGNYSIANDSILTMNYTVTASGILNNHISKISILNESELELYDVGSNLFIFRYEKITTP